MIVSRIKNSLKSRARTYSWSTYEAVKGLARPVCHSPSTVSIFLLGCQRSGSTHLERLFRADPRSCVFGEFSELSIAPDKTVWRSLADVADMLARQRAGYCVARTLLGSDLAVDMLHACPNAQVVWLFRDAPSVVRSMLNKWGDQFRPISERVEADASGDWALRRLWDEIEQDADRLGSANRSAAGRIADIYALYWLRRNGLVAQLGLNDRSDVILTSYDCLTADPYGLLNRVWRSAGVPPAKIQYPLETRRPASRPVDRPSGMSPAIEALCSDLYRTLCRQAEACAHA